jgi:hypothetical protein
LSSRKFDHEEQEFAKAVGLDANNLEWLVQDAPAISEESIDRVVNKARIKLAIAPITGRRQGFRLPRWAVAAAVVLAICGATVTLSPSVQAALIRLMQVIPGFGVTGVAPEDLVLAAPVSVADETRKMTVTGVHGTDEQTIVQVEWDGLSRTAVVTPDHTPGVALVLPDGTRLNKQDMTFTGRTGTGKLLLKLTFPALPAGTASARLELPGLFGQTKPVGVLLTLSQAASAKLPEVTPVNASAQERGLILSASHFAVDGDRIRLVLKTETNDPVFKAVAADLMDITPPGQVLKLLDDQGNAYPLLWEETALSMNDGSSRTLRENGSSVWNTGQSRTRIRPEFTAVFAGPLRPGVKSLTLTLEQAEVVESGSAVFTLDGSRITQGQWLDVQKTLTLGTREVVVKQLMYRSDGSATLTVTMNHGGPQLFSVWLNGQHMDHSSSRNGVDWVIDTEKAVVAPTTEIKIEDLRYSLKGPWSVSIDLP